MFDRFFEFFAGILAFFYGVIPNYGIAIILMTVVVMLVVTPLTYKSTKSMLQMQRLQPELKRLQAKYKDDREKLNQELMAFYKEHNLNPLGGCLPLVIQAPVFLVLYRVLRGLTDRAGGVGSGIGHVVGQMKTGASFTPYVLTDQPFNPKYVDHASKLYKSLATTAKMNFFGMDLSLSPLQAFKLGIATVIPFAILIGVMTVGQVVQQRQIQGRNANGQVNPQQQAVMKFLPYMLPVISINFPAGLGLYYFIQSLCRIGTQSYITKSLYGENAQAPIEATAVDADADAGTTKTQKAVDKATDKKSVDKKAAVEPDKRTGSTPKSQAVQKKQSGDNRPSAAGRRSGGPKPTKSQQAGRKSGEERGPTKKGE